MKLLQEPLSDRTVGVYVYVYVSAAGSASGRYLFFNNLMVKPGTLILQAFKACFLPMLDTG
jgi:hypothetical protein